MSFLKRFYPLATFILMLTFNTSAWAKPIVFEFTGTIDDTVPDNMFGEYGTRLTEHPEWNGQQISGTISLDTEGQWEYFDDDDPYTIFKSFDNSAAASDWMHVKLQNPDGTYFDSSLAVGGPYATFDPYPSSAYAQIIHLTDDAYYGVPLSNVVFNRWYHDNNSYLMYNYFELGLIGKGDDAYSLVNSKNFYELIVQPEFANLRNYGMVKQSHRDMANPSYYFSIDSFSRIETEVPEPSTLILLFSGLLVVLVKRFKVLNRN